MKRSRILVHPGRARPFEARLQLLHNDHLSPSLQLTYNAISLAEDWLEAGLPAKNLAQEFRNMHAGVAAVENLARLLSERRSRLVPYLRTLRRSLEEGNRQIADRVSRLVPPGARVITLSNSGTVEETLLRISPSKVYIVESRPGGEHVFMLQQLRRRFVESELEASVHLIEATTIGNIVPQVDCAIVGVDSISQSGAILHKVGTLPLALCCQHFGKPFYVLGHSFKKVDYDFSDSPPVDVLAETKVLDCTPAALITSIVTEQAEGATAAGAGSEMGA